MLAIGYIRYKLDCVQTVFLLVHHSTESKSIF